MKHFNLMEFDSPDLPGSGGLMNREFLMKLDTAREMADTSFVITSGYRTKEHNTRVGGVSGSSHTLGLAADIKCSDSRERSLIVSGLLRAGFNRIGIANTFIHVDLDTNKKQNVIWTY